MDNQEKVVEIKETEFYRQKLLELSFNRKMMSLDPQFSKEDIESMDENIKEVKKMYAEAYIREMNEEKEKEGRQI